MKKISCQFDDTVSEKMVLGSLFFIETDDNRHFLRELVTLISFKF